MGDYVEGSVGEEVRGGFVRHFEERRHGRVDANAIARPVLSLEGHEVGDQAEVARVHPDAVHAKHSRHLSIVAKHEAGVGQKNTNVGLMAVA